MPQGRPPALLVSEELAWKKVGYLGIWADVYEPPECSKVTKAVLFLHGGAWIGGNRKDYCRPMFKEYLEKGYAIESLDYRLKPECSFDDMLKDIVEMESWIRERRPSLVKLIVIGASAGAHLALFTPILWKQPPSKIVALYAPTNMHYLLSQEDERIIVPPGVLANDPISEYPLDAEDERTQFARSIIQRRQIVPFLLKDVHKDEHGQSNFPAGQISREEIDAISPCHFLLQDAINCPPILQIIGDADPIFDKSHAEELHWQLQCAGLKSEVHRYEGAHAFDVWEGTDSPLGQELAKRTVKWSEK